MGDVVLYSFTPFRAMSLSSVFSDFTSNESNRHEFTNDTPTDITYTVQLVGNSIYGCTDTLRKTVTVYSKVDANFAINKSFGCSPLGVDINNVLWGGNSAYRWDWDGNSMRIALYSGIRIVLQGPSRKLVQESLSFAFYYKQQDIFRQLDLGVYWYRMPLIVGVWYRGIPVFKEYPGSDAAIFLVGYKMNGIQIGYSYDATISKLGPQTGGAHGQIISLPKNKGILF